MLVKQACASCGKRRPQRGRPGLCVTDGQVGSTVDPAAVMTPVAQAIRLLHFPTGAQRLRGGRTRAQSVAGTRGRESRGDAPEPLVAPELADGGDEPSRSAAKAIDSLDTDLDCVFPDATQTDLVQASKTVDISLPVESFRRRRFRLRVDRRRTSPSRTICAQLPFAVTDPADRLMDNSHRHGG